MLVFDCECRYRFIVGKKHVYGPIFSHDLPGHFTGDPGGCYTRGKMMTREEFEDDYPDCAGGLERQGVNPHAACIIGQPCKVRA